VVHRAHAEGDGDRGSEDHCGDALGRAGCAEGQRDAERREHDEGVLVEDPAELRSYEDG
jgi:hypothetical protein